MKVRERSKRTVLCLLVMSAMNRFMPVKRVFTAYGSAGHSATRLTPCMALRGNARTVAPFSCPRHPVASYPLGPSARTRLAVVHAPTLRLSTPCRSCFSRTPRMRLPLRTRSSTPFCRCFGSAMISRTPAPSSATYSLVHLDDNTRRRPARNVS